MSPKYKMLMEYFNCSRKAFYSSIYKELEDTYVLILIRYMKIIAMKTIYQKMSVIKWTQ